MRHWEKTEINKVEGTVDKKIRGRIVGIFFNDITSNTAEFIPIVSLE